MSPQRGIYMEKRIEKDASIKSEKISLVRLWLHSSQTAKEFCSERHLTLETFSGWVQRYRLAASTHQVRGHHSKASSLVLCRVPDALVQAALQEPLSSRGENHVF